MRRTCAAALAVCLLALLGPALAADQLDPLDERQTMRYEGYMQLPDLLGRIEFKEYAFDGRGVVKLRMGSLERELYYESGSKQAFVFESESTGWRLPSACAALRC